MFGIQPTISQFKIVQNFIERCHSKANFPCAVGSIMKNNPAHRDRFQFIEILQLMHVLRGDGGGRQEIKVKFASTSVPKFNVQDFSSCQISRNLLY